MNDFKPATQNAVDIRPCSNGFVVTPSRGFADSRDMVPNEYFVFQTFEALVEHLREKYVPKPAEGGSIAGYNLEGTSPVYLHATIS